MEKDAIVAICRNHASEVNEALNYMVSSTDTMTKGFIPDASQSAYIDGLKLSMDYCKGKIDEIKAALSQWPE